MNAQKVIGIEKVSYKNKEGTQVDALRYHLCDDSPRPEVNGVTVEAVFVKAAVLSGSPVVPKLGDYVYLLRSDKGFVQGFLPGQAPAKN